MASEDTAPTKPPEPPQRSADAAPAARKPWHPPVVTSRPLYERQALQACANPELGDPY